MRRILVIAVTVCSLMWAAAGVSVLAIVYHDHHHHAAENHDHEEAFELVLHCHDEGTAPHHDHELNASMSASRSSWSGHVHLVVSEANDQVDAEAQTARSSTGEYSESRDLGPPAFLMHCVLLT